MSETPTETVTEPAIAPTTEAPAAETTTPVDFAAEAEKWKALSRKNEALAKANAEKAKQFDEIQEASKSDLEKANSQIQKLVAERDAANAAALKANIAHTKGVPAELLTGSSEEELNASADAALAWLTSQGKAAAPADKQGLDGKSADGVKQLTDADLQSMTPEQIQAARKAGQFAQLLGQST